MKPHQLDRVRRAEGGETVLANMHRGMDVELIAWAKAAGRFVRIDRKSDWGNPARLGRDYSRAEAVESYRMHLLSRPDLTERVPELRGKVLGCWCHPLPCHGDVICRELNRQTGGR